MTSSKSKLIVSLTVISVTLGFMIAIQYKNTQKINQQVNWNISNKEVLQAKENLANIQKQNQQLETQLNDMNKQVVALEQEAAKYDTSNIKKYLEQNRILAGTTPVKGPGIVLSIDDSKRGSKSQDPITHDFDIMRLVNELYLSGAEAVSINGERLGSATGILCVGPTVRVNDRLLTPPYKFEAIGDPGTLITGLTLQNGMLDELKSQNRELQIQGPKEEAIIQMNGYTGDPDKLSSSTLSNPNN